jgi:hypothetical protein
MIRLALTLVIGSTILLGLPSCKKAVDNIQKNAAYDIMTQGQWKVTKFEKSSASILPEYSGYLFQFYENGVVIARKQDAPDVSGVWSASTTVLSITASFPGQSDPLKRFNGTWLITKITATIVEGVNGEGAEPLIVGLMKI